MDNEMLLFLMFYGRFAWIPLVNLLMHMFIK